MLNIRSKIKKKILNYFFLNEDSKIYVNQLARIINEDPKNVYRILVSLEKDNFFQSEYAAQERYFNLNKDNPLCKAYKDIFLKTEGIEIILKNELKNVSGLKEAYIFGSYANDKYNGESDIDILLIGQHKALDAQKILFKLQKYFGREINAVNMAPALFQKKKTEKDQFVSSILKHKKIKIL